MGKAESKLLSYSRRDGSLSFKSYACRYNSASAQLAAQHLPLHPCIATCARHNTAPCHSHSNHHIFTEFRNRSGWRAPKQRSPSSLACEAYLSKETGERASWAGGSSSESTGIIVTTHQRYAAAILTHPYTHHRPQHLDSGPQILPA